MTAFLIVYKCTDNDEEEACFIVLDKTDGEKYITSALPPKGYEDRPGYYFIEDCEYPNYSCPTPIGDLIP